MPAQFSYARPYSNCPVGGTPAISVWGDSITWGSQPDIENPAHYTFVGGWCASMYQELVGAGRTPNLVGYYSRVAQGLPVDVAGAYHCGLGGSQPAEFLGGFAADCIAACNAQQVPNGVLWNIGANCANNVPDAVAAGQVVDLITAAWPKCNVFVGSRIPKLFNNAEDPSNIYNGQLKIECANRAANGQHVQFVNIYPVVQPTIIYIPDGLHPSYFGYLRMGGAWASVLRDWLR